MDVMDVPATDLELDSGVSAPSPVEIAAPATFDSICVDIQEILLRVQAIALRCQSEFPGDGDDLELFSLDLRVAAADLIKAGSSAIDRLQRATFMLDAATGATNNPAAVALDLVAADDLDGAIAAFEVALAAPDPRAQIHKAIADIELRRGNGESSLIGYQRALDLGFPREELQHNLALAYISQFHYEQAEEQLQQLLFRDYGLPAPQRERLSADASYPVPDEIAVTSFKLRDRAEQIEYLVDGGKLDQSFVELASAYRLGADACSTGEITNLNIAHDPSLRLIRPYHDKILYYRPTPRLAGPAVNPGLDFEGLDEQYAKSECIWFDNLLTESALCELRSFLQESTIFFRQSPAGFVGTYVTDGLSCGLIFQIAEELRKSFPRLLATRPINNMWCYRYGAEGPGVRTHNGDGSVTINFYLTPDEAHLGSPDEGGMVMFDKSHPAEWDWLSLNRDKDLPEVQDKIAAYLVDAQAERVPYRCNRAVLFESTLFHKTDPFRFKEGFENRRMNITILFGRRGQESAPLV